MGSIRGDEKLILHMNGRNEENFSEKFGALMEATGELIRDGRFTFAHNYDIPSNPANLNDEEMSFLRWGHSSKTSMPLMDGPERKIEERKLVVLFQTMEEREVSRFFEALFRYAKRDLENRSSGDLTRDLVPHYSPEDRDSVIRAFFSSARVLMCVKGWEILEHKAKAEIERVLTPLLHKTSKVIFVTRPAASVDALMFPFVHTLDIRYPDSKIQDFGSMYSYSTDRPELVEEYYGPDDFEAALYGE